MEQLQELQEHWPEHCFSKWEQQYLAEAEQTEPKEEKVEHEQDKLWHLYHCGTTSWQL